MSYSFWETVRGVELAETLIRTPRWILPRCQWEDWLDVQ